jgi:hypothetical protein
MQSKITQLEALDIFRQANELYSSNHSMYRPKEFSPDEISSAQLQYLRAASFLESVPAEYVSTDMQTLLGKCYLQDLYFTRYMQAVVLSTSDKHQLNLYVQNLVTKYKAFLSTAQHLTEVDKQIQLMVCQVFSLGKNRGKGYSSKVTALGRELQAYFPFNEHAEFFTNMTVYERMNFAWHADNVAALVKGNGSDSQQYLELAQNVRATVEPPIMVVPKPEPVKVLSFGLEEGARAALHRSREIGKSEREVFAEAFLEFAEDAQERVASQAKKANMGH